MAWSKLERCGTVWRKKTDGPVEVESSSFIRKVVETALSEN
jgi:hypothetical protein